MTRKELKGKTKQFTETFFQFYERITIFSVSGWTAGAIRNPHSEIHIPKSEIFIVLTNKFYLILQ